MYQRLGYMSLQTGVNDIFENRQKRTEIMYEQYIFKQACTEKTDQNAQMRRLR